jgi:hypothetical protein
MNLLHRSTKWFLTLITLVNRRDCKEDRLDSEEDRLDSKEDRLYSKEDRWTVKRTGCIAKRIFP